MFAVGPPVDTFRPLLRTATGCCGSRKFANVLLRADSVEQLPIAFAPHSCDRALRSTITPRIVAAFDRTVLVARNGRSPDPPHPRKSDASTGLEFLEWLRKRSFSTVSGQQRPY